MYAVIWFPPRENVLQYRFILNPCFLQHHKSCKEIQEQIPAATSGVYEIYPLTDADPIKVYCERDIAGGGFTFLPHSLNLKSDAQQIVDSLFKDKKNVLLKLKKNVDGSEWYTLIQPHPNYADIDFGVLVNNYSGYTEPKNVFMQKYVLVSSLNQLQIRKQPRVSDLMAS